MYRFRIAAAGVAAIIVGTVLPSQGYAVADPLPGAAPKPADFAVQLPFAPGVTHTITQAYGSGLHQGTDRTCCNNDYYALDMDFSLDEPVYAIAPGKVVFAGPAAGSWATFGNIVFVDHGNGYQSLYAHLNSVHVSTGDGVGSRTVLGGAGGSGGWRTHLHFALYSGARFYNTHLGTGQYGGQAAVPEPFTNCVKAGGGACENLRTRDRLTNTGGSEPAVPVTPGNLNSPIRSLSSGAAVLQWQPEAGTLQFHIQVVPLNNDGPAVDLIIADPVQVASGAFTIDPPTLGRGNYVLLPGAHYTWRVRQGSLLGWGSWSETQSFSRPMPNASTLTVQVPGPTNVNTPTIRWADSDPVNFYYEVQLSSDPSFGSRAGAVAPVYSNLVHGGTTDPLNSWTVPASASLAPGTYYARVRQRVQATPAGAAETGVAWTVPAEFEILR